MSAPFAPGDVVVCVDDRPGKVRWCPEGDLQTVSSGLRRFSTYRVDRIAPAPCGDIGLTLVGIAPPVAWDGELPFNPNRFRKVDDEQYPEVLERLKSLSTPKERVET